MNEINAEWLKTRGFPDPIHSGWTELRIGGIRLQVNIQERQIDVEDYYAVTLPIPFTCEAVQALIDLLTPPPATIFALFNAKPWVAVLRRARGQKRWRFLSNSGDEWAWCSTGNATEHWVPRDQLPTTGEIAILRRPEELNDYPLE